MRFTVSGQAPCSDAERRDKELDAVSTAIHGGAAAVNLITSPAAKSKRSAAFCCLVDVIVVRAYSLH